MLAAEALLSASLISTLTPAARAEAPRPDHGLSEYFFQVDRSEFEVTPTFAYSGSHTEFSSGSTNSAHAFSMGSSFAYGLTETFSVGTEFSYSNRTEHYDTGGSSTFRGLANLNLTLRTRLPMSYGTWHVAIAPSFTPGNAKFDLGTRVGNAFSGGQSLQFRLGFDHRFEGGVAVGARGLYDYRFNRDLTATQATTTTYSAIHSGGSYEMFNLFGELPFNGGLLGLAGSFTHQSPVVTAYSFGNTVQTQSFNELSVRFYSAIRIDERFDLLVGVGHSFYLSGDGTTYLGFNSTQSSVGFRMLF